MLAEINTMEHLKKNLHMGPGYGGYVELLNALALPKNEWDKFCTWEKDNYTRNCISSCEDYELLLLCWEKNQASPIHNYDFQEGWIKVLQGELTIDTYEVDRDDKTATKKGSLVLKNGESTYLNDSMGFHKVANPNGQKTVSLHLNIGPVKKWEVFNESKKELETVEPKLDTNTKDCE
ncbi:MAG: cysteine dioxygenase family protein [Vicingaceae bacterium]